MTRPRFVSGQATVLQVRNRSGKKSLAVYLASRLGVVETWAADLIADGNVSLDGTVATPGQLINLSDGPHSIAVRFPDAWPKHMAATAMTLDILYEDAYLVVLNKPPGVVVHPARGHLDNQTLQNGVRFRYRHLLGGENITIGPPHRLDKDTSGAIIFALTKQAYVNLVEQFASGQPHKRYLAILDLPDSGPPFAHIVCDKPVGNDPDHKGRGKVLPVEHGGKTARTGFRMLEKGTGWALAEAVPQTGRAHQIRIHAASLDVPLAGDREYNPHPDRLGLQRQALHAAELSFAHPIGGQTLRVRAPLAEDLRMALERLRSGELPTNGVIHGNAT